MTLLKIYNDPHIYKKLFLEYPLHEVIFDDIPIIDQVSKNIWLHVAHLEVHQ